MAKESGQSHVMTGRDQPQIRVGLLPWGQVIEDFLEGLQLEVEDFVSAMSGGWLFGYVEALATAGVSVVIICVSADVYRLERRVHAPTGVTLWLLPPTRAWRIAGGFVADRQAWSVRDAVLPEPGVVQRLAAVMAHHALPWLSTPRGALKRVIAMEKLDCLLCQEYEDARLDLCLLAARSRRIPVTATFQGGSASRTPLERFIRPVSMRAVAHLFVGSEGEIARIGGSYGVGPDRVSRVPNPIVLADWPVGDRRHARAALGIPYEAEVVSWHGRIDLQRKGLDVLLAAWNQLAIDASRPQVLLLVGDGDDANELRIQLARMDGDVRWHDRYVTDRKIIREHLAAADVAVLPSRHEGFAVALLEAMASGRAVVASDVPGVTDTAPRGEQDGVLVVPPGDHQALAAGLRRVLSDGPLAAAMGRAARTRVEQGFSLQAVGDLLSASIIGAIDRRHSFGASLR